MFKHVKAVAAILFVAIQVSALAEDTPYSIIADKNVFRLNPPPPPDAPEPPKVDLPVIKISGFMRMGAEERVLFASVPKDPKELPTYYSLADGERQGILELVKGNPKREEADVIISGTPMTLTVKDNSFLPKVEPSGGRSHALPGALSLVPYPGNDAAARLGIPSRTRRFNSPHGGA